MSVREICQYNEQRLCLLVSNCGPTGVWISTRPDDLLLPRPTGIYIAGNGLLRLPWIEVGEICWYEWQTTCDQQQLGVWEWLSTPQYCLGILSPTETKDDYRRDRWPDPRKGCRPRLTKRCG